jgi:hypothetical protein
VASVPRDGADGGSANGGGGKVVMLKSKKKRMMDHERYLDATQRCVGHHINSSLPSIYLSLSLFCDPLVPIASVFPVSIFLFCFGAFIDFPFFWGNIGVS